MARAHARRDTVTIRVGTRFLLVGVLGALLLVGALNAGAGAISPAEQDQAFGHTSIVVQHEATVTANAASPSRSHRLVLPGAFLIFTCLAAIAARRVSTRGHRDSRRRVEQFHVRLRGPPHLLVAF
jgi:hypothetical protein